MTIILGLLLLAVAVGTGITGLLIGAGPAGVTVFTSGLVAGLLGMVGQRLVHGDIAGRRATRRLGRLRRQLQEEIRLVSAERDAVADELRRERAGKR